MRNRRNTNVRSAFTLIEILIVVVILGILAAIVVPQFTNAADDANDASVRSQLQTLRSQIELYRAQNPTSNPVGADTTPVWNNMLDGDYLTTAPLNPLTGSSTTATSAAVPALGELLRPVPTPAPQSRKPPLVSLPVADHAPIDDAPVVLAECWACRQSAAGESGCQ